MRGGERSMFARPISCELPRRLGFGPERFFAVPANRDMDRKIEVAAWRALRD